MTSEASEGSDSETKIEIYNEKNMEENGREKVSSKRRRSKSHSQSSELSRTRSRSMDGNRRSRSKERSPNREPKRSRSKERKRRRRTRSRSPYSRSLSPGEKRLHIANLDDSVRRRDVEDTFSKYGKLSDIWVATYPPFYAFVVYERSSDAREALRSMKNGYIRNCPIRTSIALPRANARRDYDRDRYRRRSRSRSRSRRRRSRSRSRRRRDRS